MAKVRVRKETGTLYLDFHYKGVRCREQTALADTLANRRTLEVLAKKVHKAIAGGTFDYASFFPDSRRLAALSGGATPVQRRAPQPPEDSAHGPLFREFAETWFAESQPRWRPVYSESTRRVIDGRLLPTFGDRRIGEITRADLLGFRARIAQQPGRGSPQLSAKRVNKIMMILRAILNEGCDRHGLVSPGRGVKPLKQKRSEVQPFNLEDVERLLGAVRPDYRPYLTVRCFTGLRTGEANGLQWDDVDFDAGVIHIRRTYSRAGDGDVKTDISRRTIDMMPMVRAALEHQRTMAIIDCPWVFHTRNGKPLDAINFTNRIWYPLLRRLEMKLRPPYQMRHTAATLMLASGENPEWIARTLGHSTTEMLFRVYSRFVPNLTRNDGRAFSGLLHSRLMPAPTPITASPIDALDALSKDELLALVKRLTTPTGGR